ncbi:MAG: acyl-CoA dehydrogenase, partial [bacterium]|nr:acyl-CoA dehydrogenase [bacterium]
MVKDMTHSVARDTFRPVARKYDEEEHTKAEEIQFLGEMMGITSGGPPKKKDKKEDKPKGPKPETDDRIGATMMTIVGTEELCWGDCGLMLAIPSNGLGNFAISAVATPDQLERFGSKFASMAITEPGSGSDSGSISTTATLDGEEWVINGEKIFVTDGRQCEAVVVWATIDKSAGKAG